MSDVAVYASKDDVAAEYDHVIARLTPEEEEWGFSMVNPDGSHRPMSLGQFLREKREAGELLSYAVEDNGNFVAVRPAELIQRIRARGGKVSVPPTQPQPKG
jgi:hypothetical protein